ncbi:hypothetical protein DNTS_000499 [Danionella cerebrum]|uniref:Proteasome assembly chaperone 1 n=1 Tax=Danionella cerebrum TaxID=2873325 RepID=A0A553RNV8_9TELE|nr:hypothetical protein DNTS_000499 [Danionella translucida]
MATFFGEVLSVYSRAVEEDEYDDQCDENEEDQQILRELEEKRSVDVQWLLKSVTGPMPCSDLIIATGPNATGFLSACVLGSGGWRPIAWFCLWNERSRGTERPSKAPAPGEPSCMLYQQETQPTVLICQCQCYLAEDQLFQWTEKVFSCVQSRDLTVTLLSDCAVSEYKSSEYLSDSSVPFLRCLKTDKHSKPQLCPALEPPNICTGAAAAVLSHCQVHQISAVLFLGYTEGLHTDSRSMGMYAAPLSSLLKV